MAVTIPEDQKRLAVNYQVPAKFVLAWLNCVGYSQQTQTMLCTDLNGGSYSKP